MLRLNIDTFIKSAHDSELSEYRLLAALKNYTDELHKNKLYPAFGDLVDLSLELESILLNKQLYQKRINRIKGIDLENGKFLYEEEIQNISSDSMEHIFDFIQWALPKLKVALDEGKAIYDYVEEGLEIKEVGIIPLFKDEGYFTISDQESKRLCIYKYVLSKLASLDVNFQTLKTNLIESYSDIINTHPIDEIKYELIKKYPELPNPVLFKVETEIDFPFNETVLPIAKRKLMHHLAA